MEETMRGILMAAVLALVAIGLGACRDLEEIEFDGTDDGGADSDTDSDTDGDVDTESDTYPDAECVSYVNADADPGGDGLSWESAFDRIQDGVAYAADAAGALDTTCQVWVAEGTYYVYESSRVDTIALATGVALLGGFIGTETSVSQRDWRDNLTVLDGHEGPAAEHQVYHVVFSDGDGVIDGFTVTGGRADSEEPEGADMGGGIFLATGQALVANCTIVGNSATYGGGGVAVGYGWGSSEAVSERHPTITGCTFADNAGKALYSSSATPIITRCLFHDNADGAIQVDDSLMTITSCTFDHNGDQPGNAIEAYGAATYLGPVTNVVAWSDLGQPILDEAHEFLEVSLSDVRGGFPGDGNIDEDPQFVDATGGDYRLGAGSPCIDAASGEVAPEFDLDGYPRVDDPDAPNTGIGPPWADMGAYELQPE